MKVTFNTIEPMNMGSGDKFTAELNSSAPKSERPVLKISVIDQNSIEIMLYKSEGKLLFITEDEIYRMDMNTLLDADKKHTIKRKIVKQHG